MRIRKIKPDSKVAKIIEDKLAHIEAMLWEFEWLKYGLEQNMTDMEQAKQIANSMVRLSRKIALKSAMIETVAKMVIQHQQRSSSSDSSKPS